MSKFTKEQLAFLEKSVIMKGLDILAVKSDIYEVAGSITGFVKGNVRQVHGTVGIVHGNAELVVGDVGWVRGNVTTATGRQIRISDGISVSCSINLERK